MIKDFAVPFTAPKNGMVAIFTHGAWDSSHYIYINGNAVAYNHRWTGCNTDSVSFIIGKGDIVETAWEYRYFIPFK